MTNMMNGAVAIYGGVGVMEIHQPLPQAVESVAQAVEDLAVNAHISLRELKNTVAAVIERMLCFDAADMLCRRNHSLSP